MSSLAKRATGQWAAIFRAHAMEIANAMARPGRHIVCPVHGGEDGFRLYPDWEQSGGGVCNTCGNFHNGVDLLMWLRQESFASVASRVEGIIGKPPADKEPIDPSVEKKKLRLRKVQEAAVKAGDLVRPYLESRGLEVPPGLHEGRMIYWDTTGESPQNAGEFPVMLGKFVSPEGTPITWHVTYLNGPRKADVASVRKMLPKATEHDAGGAVRLYKAEDTLGIAEGIETAIAAKMLTGTPCWAACNAVELAKFRPPKGVKKLIIFGDSDNSYAGQAAAYLLASRVWARLESVEVRIPFQGDWADVQLMKRAIPEKNIG